MASTITFDKLRFVQGVRNIKSLKMTQKEAEEFAQVIEVAMTETVATKADLAELKSELKQDFTQKIYSVVLTVGLALALMIIGLYLK